MRSFLNLKQNLFWVSALILVLANTLNARPDTTDLGVDSVTLELPDLSVKRQSKPIQVREENSIQGLNLEKQLGRSLGDALSSVEGVSLLQSGPTISKPEIHGLQGNRIQILNNGTKLEGQQWGSEHAPEVDPFLAGSLTIIKGPAGVRYGPEALGGVILVTPRPLRSSPGSDGEWHTLITSAGMGGASSLRWDIVPASLPGLSLRGQGTLRRLGDQKAPEYVLKNTALSEINGSVAAKYGMENYSLESFYSHFETQLGLLSAAHVGNLTDFQEALSRDIPEESGDFQYTISRPKQHVTHDLIKVRGIRYSKMGNLEFTYSFQDNTRSEFDKHRPLNDSLAALDRPELQFKIYTHTTDVIYEQIPFYNISGSVGAAFSHQGNAASGRSFVPNFENNTGGVFALEQWHYNKIGMETGVRLDYRHLEIYRNIQGNIVNTTFKEITPSASLGGVYNLDSTSHLRLNFSTSSRPPSASELYSNGLHHGAAAVEYGDTTLKFETAYHVTLSFSHHSQKRFNAKIEFFTTYIRNFIGLQSEQPPTLTIRGAFPTFRYRNTDALLRGADFRTSLSALPWLKWGFTGSLFWAQDDNTGEGLLFMPSHHFENSLSANGPKWSGFSNPYATLRLQSFLKQTNPASNDYTEPPPGYHLWHANMGFSWKLFDVELQIRNLLNKSYRSYTNRFRYFTDEPGREFALRLKYSFN